MKDQASDFTSLYKEKGISICFQPGALSLAVVQECQVTYKDEFIFRSFQFEEQIKQATSFLERNIGLTKGIQKAVLSFANTYQTIVPACFYSANEEEDFLQFNIPLEKNSPIERNYINKYDAYLIFSYKEEVEELVRELYRKVIVLHSGAWLLASKEAYSGEKEMHLVFYHKQFDMLILKGGELILYTPFEYSANEDILYYVLFTAKSLNMDANHFFLFVEGRINLKSASYILLSKYVRNLHIRKNNPTSKSALSHKENYLLSSFQCGLSLEI